MAKITHLVERSRAEILLDQIASILADELPSQATLAGDTSLHVDKVWCSRLVRFDKTELPTVNVSILTGDYSSKTTRTQDVTYIYALDVFSRGDTDTASSARKNRIAGIIRGILDNPIYKTLDLPAPVVRTTIVRRMTHQDPVDESNLENVTMCRLEFEVQTWEDTKAVDAIELNCSGTVVKLFDTDKGYYWGTCEDEGGGIISEDEELPVVDEEDGETFFPESTSGDEMKLSQTPLVESADGFFVPLFLPDVGNFHIAAENLGGGGSNIDIQTIEITADETASELSNTALIGAQIIGMIFIDKMPYDSSDGITLDPLTGTLNFIDTASGMIYEGQRIVITIKK